MVDRIRREADHARAAGGESEAVAPGRSGDGGRIVAVMNNLEDPAMVRELYAAAQAGVEIDLVIRGICRLRPGLDGISDSIRVRSVVGRFLEHSRILYFGNAGAPEYYIGSADWMTRNLDRRVEAVTPVEDPDHRAYLDRVVELMLADDRKAWVMGEDGSYEQLRPGGDDGHSVQTALMALARHAAQGKAVGDDLPGFPWND
jgi:polyphosphate kinase